MTPPPPKTPQVPSVRSGNRRIICPLSPAHIAGAAAFHLYAILLFVDVRMAPLPLIAFLVSCFIAPFLPRIGFYLPIVGRGKPGEKGVALTFDDGPDPEVTPRLLDLLDRHSVPATFFVLGAVAADRAFDSWCLDEQRRNPSSVFFFVPLARILSLSLDASILAPGNLQKAAGILGFTFYQALLSTLLTFALGLPAAVLFARFTRSLVEKPVTASRNLRKRLLVSMITATGAVMSDAVSMMTDLLPAPIVTSRRLRAPDRMRYPFSVFSGSAPKQFFSSATALSVSAGSVLSSLPFFVSS